MKKKTPVEGHFRVINGKKQFVKPHARKVEVNPVIPKPVTKRVLKPANIRQVKVDRKMIVPSEEKLEELFSRVEKINKKAARYGFGGFELESKISTDTDILEAFPELESYDYIPNIPLYEVSIKGQMPKIEGNYEYVGILENSIDGEDALVFGEHNRLTEATTNIDWAYCDKCGLKRNRSKLLVLEDKDTGELLRVGGECSKDYFENNFKIENFIRDSTDIEELLNDDDGDDSFRGGWSSGVFAPQMHDPNLVVQVAAAVVAEDGEYISVDKGRWGDKEPTSRRVNYILMGNMADIMEKAEKLGAFSTENIEKVEAMFDWAENLDDQTLRDNQYLYNIHQLAKTGAVTRKRVGLMASLVAAYDRAQEQAEKKAVEKEKNARFAGSKHIGKVGDSLKKLNLEVIGSKYLGEGTFGDRYLVTLTDVDNNVYTSFVGDGKVAELDEGDEIVMSSGKVADHTEFRDIKQTQLKNIRFKTGGRLGELERGEFEPEVLEEILEQRDPKAILAVAPLAYKMDGKVTDEWLEQAEKILTEDENIDDYKIIRIRSELSRMRQNTEMS